jgi:hypothetical protein
MQAMFQVRQRGRESRWIVTLGNTIYGAYIPISIKSKHFSMRLTRRAIHWKPGARLRSGLRNSRTYRVSSNGFSTTCSRSLVGSKFAGYDWG